MINTEIKYALMLQSRLKRFVVKKQHPFLANFRCSVCNDSEKNERKCRGYIYEKTGNLNYYCQNCGYSHKFRTYLKEFDPELYRDYQLESFKDSDLKWEEPVKTKAANWNYILKDVKKISQLSADHPAKKFVEKRKIPSNQHYKLYFTPNFNKWVASHCKDYTDLKLKLDPRLILPLIDKDQNLFGVQGRDLTNKASLRYVTNRFDEQAPKLFGGDKFNPNYKGYLFEGPIDSLFIENSLAMAGADISFEQIEKATLAQKEKLTVCLDNEPRNKQIVAKYKRYVDNGHPICFWPQGYEYKDVNDAIIGGYTQQQIKDLIDKNTFTGLLANLQFQSWVKI